MATSTTTRPVKLRDLAGVIGCSESQVRFLAHNLSEKSKYQLMLVPKKGGGFRDIFVPRKELKYVQRQLLAYLETLYYPNGRATAYIKGTSIVRNARFHQKNRLVLNIDLEDFFGQITAPRLYGMLTGNPYLFSNSVTTAIINLTCLNGSVPQGAPTSPILANMLCSYFDRLMVELCRKYGCSYTRYSDDITISTNRRRFPRSILRHGAEPLVDAYSELGDELMEVFKVADFRINPSKVRLLQRHDRQEVTGLTINEFVNPRREHFRRTRKMLHILHKFGEDEALREFNRLNPRRPLSSYTDSVRGRIEFLKYVRGAGNTTINAMVQKFNEIASPPIKYVGPEDWLSRITSPVVCLENMIDCRQGTAFHIGQGVFITNNHVVHYEGAFDSKMKFVVAGSGQRLPITLLRSFPDADLSFICCGDQSRAFMLPTNAAKLSGNQKVDLGSEVTVVGFPDWQEGDTHHIEKGAVTALTTRNGIASLRLSCKIFFGNSGGPIYNKMGEVVGVAYAGASVMDDVEFSYLAVAPHLVLQALHDARVTVHRGRI